MKYLRHGNNEENEKLSISNKPNFKIPISLPRRHLINSSNSSTSSSSSSIHSIAYTMKHRMKMAFNKMVYDNNLPTHMYSDNNTMPIIEKKNNLSTASTPSSFVKPTLKNGALLKQYLSFIENELNTSMDIHTSENMNYYDASQLTLTTKAKAKTNQVLNKSGATLIEAMVHQNDYDSVDEEIVEQVEQMDVDQQEVIQIKFTNSEQSTRRKSRSLHQSSSPPKIKPRSSSVLKNQHPHHHNKVSMIRCICTTPNEEFGAMVQCDDCASWLHLDCLALDEHALDETFRCPSCFITLGPGQHHLTSSLTWRFAAQIKSKRLASRKQKKKLSNDKKKFYQRYHQRQDYYSSSSEDESDYQQPDWVIKEQEQELQQQKQQQQSVLKNKKDQEEEENIDSDTTETDWEINLKRKKLEISISNNSNNNNSSSSSRTTPSLPSLSPSQPIHSGCSSDLDSPSEASTPDHEDGFFHHHSTMTNNFIHSTATSSTCLMDNESLMWLSRLAYLESLQTSCNSHQQQCFMPNASDVFLCEQQQQQRNHHHLSSSPPSSSSSPLPLLLVPTLSASSSSSSSSITNRSDLPSTICSQDLSQYSFDDGPFWSPIQ